MHRFFLFRPMDAAPAKRSPRRHRGAKNSAAVKSVCRRSARSSFRSSRRRGRRIWPGSQAGPASSSTKMTRVLPSGHVRVWQAACEDRPKLTPMAIALRRLWPACLRIHQFTWRDAPKAAHIPPPPISRWWATKAPIRLCSTGLRAISPSAGPASTPSSSGWHPFEQGGSHAGFRDRTAMSAPHTTTCAKAPRSIGAPSRSSAPRPIWRASAGTEERLVVRMIHACGMTDLPKDVEMSPDFAEARRQRRFAVGAPILCDSKMVANGITRARLPAGNDVICTLDDPRVPALARELGNTRSAAAMELWRERLAGSIVVFGNAPTALFRLLEMLMRRRAATCRRDRHPGRLRRRCRIEAGSCRNNAIFPSWSCTDGAAARRWRPRRSMPWRVRTNERRSETRIRLYGVGLGPGDPDYMTVARAEDFAERRPARPFLPEGQTRQRTHHRRCGRGARSRARDRSRLSCHHGDRRARPRLCGRHHAVL